jgi:pilus assembly protein CpaC
VAVSDPDIAPVRLIVGRSTVVKVGAPITRISLTSADIADAVVTGPSELLINGKTPGEISMFVWSRSGALSRYAIVVQRDLTRLADQLKQLFPGESIDVQANGRSAVLSGTVSTKDIADKAVSLAGGFVEKKDEVISLLQISNAARSNQVLLRVRFAEVSRSAVTDLGVSFFTSALGIKNTVGQVSTGQFPSAGFQDLGATKTDSTFGGNVASASGKLTFSDLLNVFLFNEKYDLGALLKAMQTKGLFQSLAEPNLVAESGKEASFLAGGEFPIPVPQVSAGGTAITVQYKEFGVRLNFTPTVVGDRVRLKVRPEVSTLDFNNAITLNGFRIPALSTRRTETEIELQNHQTFAIAGLLNNSVLSTMQKIPGIGDIPVLGLLFKSKSAQKNQTELVVMITPEILPLSSPGVTPTLPRQVEPYLPALPEKRTFQAPPTAFAPTASVPAPAAATPMAAAQASPAISPTTSPTTSEGAAAAVAALTPGGPSVVHAVEPPSVPADASAQEPAPEKPSSEQPTTSQH